MKQDDIERKNNVDMIQLIFAGQIGILTKSVCRGDIFLCQISDHFYTSKYSTYVRYLCLNLEFLKVKLIYGIKFKVCKSVPQHTVQINQPTRCNNFSSLLLDVYVQLNMFRASSRPSSGAQRLQ